MDIRDEPLECRVEDNIGLGMCSTFVIALLPIKDARGEPSTPFDLLGANWIAGIVR